MTLLEKDLKKIIKGDLLFDDITRQIYSFGASIYKIKPKGVVMPKDKDDVIALVRYANEKGITLTARGACTSLAGQAVGNGIIIDFTKYMNRLIDYGGEDYANVEPGIVYGELNKITGKFGKFFPPDPSSGDYCTIGGMIANNSGGPHSVKYGNTAGWIEELEVVLSTGEPVELKPGSSIKSITEPLCELFKNNKETIKRFAPKVKRNASGYNVYDVMKDGSLDLVKLMVGSEGTLAIITRAKLKLAALPGSRRVLLLSLKDASAVADVIPELQALDPSAIEFMDATFVKLATEVDPKLKNLLPKETARVFLLEFEEGREGEADDKVSYIKRKLIDEEKLLREVKAAKDAQESDRIWALRRAAVPIMNRIKGKKRPIPFIEDAIVPPDRLDEFIIGAYALFDRYSVDACVYGHAGDGNMHIRPLLDMKDKLDLIKIDNMADDFYRLVISLGGSTTAEHGDGMLRVPYLRKQFGPLYAVFSGIKDIFDPKGILNPGKKIGKEDSITHDLIYDPEVKYMQTNTIFDSEPVRDEIEKCHACGLCRNACPVNISLPQESASPRAKAAILKAVINGRLDKKFLFDPAIKDLLDLCLNCKSCRVECPTGADISLLSSLAKENYVKEAGIPLSQKFLEDARFLGSVLSASPGFINGLLNSSVAKTLLEVAIGIDKRRAIPKPSVPIFEKRISSRKGGKRKVAYFYGCYVNFFNAGGEGEAVIKVLQKNDIDVILPKQRCCGIPSASSGDIKAARKDMEYNLKRLYEAVKADYDVITSCPSCGLALKEEYPRILNNAEAVLLSQKAFDVLEYLWLLFDEGALNTGFKPSNKKVVIHAPCHLKAQEIGDLQGSLIELIPGISIAKTEDSCCGMAGTFGLNKKNYDLSMRIGKRLFANIKDASPDLVVTSCGACATQIKEATSLKIIHPIQLLAEYYY